MIRLFYLIVILSVMNTVVGCNHQEKDIFFCNWESEGTESDSLVRLLEKESLFNKVPLDTVLSQVDFLSKISPAKASFFKGRILRQNLHRQEAESLLLNLKASVDSSNNVYLVQRINRELSLLSPVRANLYFNSSHAVNYFKDVNDPILTAACYIDMGNVLSDLNDYDKALYYLNLGQNIYKENGLEELSLRNSINIANVYGNKGDSLKSDSVYHELIKAKSLKNDKYVMELILRNYFLSSNNPELLYEAIGLSQNEPSMKSIYALHTSLMADYWLENDNLDSVLYYVEESMANIGHVKNLDHKSLILRKFSDLKRLQGQPDSALHYFQMSVAYADSSYQQRDYVKVETLESQRAIAAMELETMEQRFKERVLWTIIISVIIIATIVVLWISNKKHQSAKLQQIQSQLELEQARRSFAAKSIAMEEKERIIGETRKRLQEMSQEGKIKNDVATELVSMIKMHESGQMEWENFVTLFEKVSPNFTKNLKAQYPDLSETLVKLATYLFSGMSSAQISRLLMIRLESVHQARWRLRKKMNLPNDSSLEDALRRLDT